MADYSIAPKLNKRLDLSDINSVFRSQSDQAFDHFTINEKGRLTATTDTRPGNYDPKPSIQLLTEAYTQTVGEKPDAQIKNLIAKGVAGQTATGTPQSLHEFEHELRSQANLKIVQKIAPGADLATQQAVADSFTKLNTTPTPETVSFGVKLMTNQPSDAVDLACSHLLTQQGLPADQANTAKLAAEVLLKREDFTPNDFQKIGGALIAHEAAKVSAQNPNAFMRGHSAGSAFSGQYLKSGPGAELMANAIQDGYQNGNNPDTRAAGMIQSAAENMSNYPDVQDYLGTLAQSAKQQLITVGIDSATADKLSNVAQTDAFALRGLGPEVTEAEIGTKQERVAMQAKAQLIANPEKNITNDPTGLLAGTRVNLDAAYTNNQTKGQAVGTPVIKPVDLTLDQNTPAQDTAKTSVREMLRGAADRISSTANSLKTAVVQKVDQLKMDRLVKQIEKRQSHLENLENRRDQAEAHLKSSSIAKTLSDLDAGKIKFDADKFRDGTKQEIAEQQDIMDALKAEKDFNKLKARVSNNKDKLADLNTTKTAHKEKMDLRANRQDNSNKETASISVK